MFIIFRLDVILGSILFIVYSSHTVHREPAQNSNKLRKKKLCFNLKFIFKICNFSRNKMNTERKKTITRGVVNHRYNRHNNCYDHINMIHL